MVVGGKRQGLGPENVYVLTKWKLNCLFLIPVSFDILFVIILLF